VSEIIPYVQLLMRLARVEVRINDIPVLLKETDGVTSSMRPIREFLVNGTNAAKFIVEPTDLPLAYRDEEPTIREGCAVRMRIADVEDGEFLDFNVGAELLDLAVKPTTEAVPPVVMSGEFEAKSAHRWAWTTATAIDPVADRAAIDAYVSEVAGHWANRDADRLTELLQTSFSDEAKAYPANAVEHREIDFRNALAEGDQDSWKPMPFDPDRAVYRSVGNGKLIEVLDTDGLPLVRTEVSHPGDPTATPGYFPFPMMVGFVNGSLKILL